MPPDEPPTPDRAPTLAAALRRHGLALVAIAVAAFGYLDLRARIDGAPAIAGEGSDAGASAPAPDAGAPPRAVLGEHVPPPDWGCTGDIAPDMVGVSIGRHGAGVLACIAQPPQAPRPGSTLTIRMRVATDGHVDAAHVSGVTDDALVRCAGEDALRWRFPPPVGGACALVEAPFVVPASRSTDGL